MALKLVFFESTANTVVQPVKTSEKYTLLN